ncbi:MAG: exodeoxyribonuclease V subunit alpha [Gammaproteobacteria bacterium]
MSLLSSLQTAGELSPLSCVFARFIARHCNVAQDSLLVMTAALLSERNQHGDVCLELNRFAEQTLFTAQVGHDAIVAPSAQQWQQLLLESECVGGPGDSVPMIVEHGRLYLQRFWHYECAVYEAINARLGQNIALQQDLLRDGLERLFPAQASASPVDWQKLGSALASSQRFAVISGGPGTGKTTTVVKVLALLFEQNPALRIKLAAPTGKAAARMVESIRSARQRLDLKPEIASLLPDEASTLHRLLAYQDGNGYRGFRHNRQNPLLLDCLVIDEASMIDLPLMWSLLEACPTDMRIILLGDRDQLASVEAGNVLGDITGHGQALHYSQDMVNLLQSLTGVEASLLPVSDNVPAIADSLALLRTSHRFAADSGIGALASAVNNGEVEIAQQLLRQANVDVNALALSDIVWISPPSNPNAPLHSQVLQWALAQYRPYFECTEVEQALAIFAKTRILCAAHEGPLGERELNRQVADRLRRVGALKGADETHGTPIMVTVNDYEMGLFNGDIGLLWYSEQGVLEACFPDLDGEVRRIPAASLPEHVSAWAMTVHKSQGSEFNEVLLILPSKATSPLLLRELVYTGITRARTRLLLHSSTEALAKACRTPVQRSSGLAARLGWETTSPD